MAGGRISVGGGIVPPPYTFGPANQGLVAWSADPELITGSGTPLAATINLVKVPVPYSLTATNIVVFVKTAGTSYTNTQMGLYSSAGTFLGATAVLASAGTNTFGTTGPKTVALTSAVALTGGSGVFVWAALHMGTNNATAVVVAAPSSTAAGSDSISNIGLTAATARQGSYTGHATNDLATIGNLTPASISLAGFLPWLGIS